MESDYSLKLINAISIVGPIEYLERDSVRKPPFNKERNLRVVIMKRYLFVTVVLGVGGLTSCLDSLVM